MSSAGRPWPGPPWQRRNHEWRSELIEPPGHMQASATSPLDGSVYHLLVARPFACLLPVFALSALPVATPQPASYSSPRAALAAAPLRPPTTRPRLRTCTHDHVSPPAASSYHATRPLRISCGYEYSRTRAPTRSSCYTCHERVPQWRSRSWRKWLEGQQWTGHPPRLWGTLPANC